MVIQAMQWTGENTESLSAWLQSHQVSMWTTQGDGYTKLMILTLEGTMETSPGDYVIRGTHGEFYPCKPYVFETTYESVEEARA